MMKAIGALALCGSLLAVPAPAVAAPQSGATLRILVTVKDADSKTATLNCYPAGGTHSSALQACALLALVGGDPEKLNVNPGAVCTREFRPSAVIITGTWQDKPVWFGQMYANPCQMRAAGGAVFTP
ncbi:MAG TPA: SSI family serine proteinase inhibitor [Nonomuraea sp.]|uniref:SSI family serine proteinase inhibitor n=1 Tax=Nonomuraea sp. NPDC049649 TaxID=3155776 RepID=UPI002BA52AE3|nr:SSI family serine proteinase inhibitor [Nonomuraea sp.]